MRIVPSTCQAHLMEEDLPECDEPACVWVKSWRLCRGCATVLDAALFGSEEATW